MYNVPDNLSASLDPAADFSDDVEVGCDQLLCGNRIKINTDEQMHDLETTCGVTCDECLTP